LDIDGVGQMKRIRHLSRKLAKLLLGIVLSGLLIALTLFTPIGNRLLTPLVEKWLTSALATPVTVDIFELSPSRFSLEVRDNVENTFSTQGEYSLLTVKAFGYYRIYFDHPHGINPFDTRFHSTGAFSGRYSSLDILGDIEGFGGTLTYKTQLNRLTLDSIHLNASHIEIQALLNLLGYPSITSTVLDGRVDLSGFITRNVEGNIAVETHTSSFTPTPILKDSNESIDLASLLTDDKGYIKRFTAHVSADLNLEEVGVLEQIIGLPVRGPVKIRADLSGDQHDLRLDGSTDLALSDSTFSIGLQRLQPQQLHFTINHARIERLFSFLDQNAPIGGMADASGDLNLSGGNLRLNLYEGITYPKILKREYNLTQPEITFITDISAALSRKEIHYQGTFRSNLSRFQIEGTTTHDQMLRELLNSIR